MNMEKIQQLTESIQRTAEALNQQCQGGSYQGHHDTQTPGAPNTEKQFGPNPSMNPFNFGGSFPSFGSPWGNPWPNSFGSWGSWMNGAPSTMNPWSNWDTCGWDGVNHNVSNASCFGGSNPSWMTQSSFPYYGGGHPSFMAGPSSWTPNGMTGWGSYPYRGSAYGASPFGSSYSPWRGHPMKNWQPWNAWGWQAPMQGFGVAAPSSFQQNHPYPWWMQSMQHGFWNPTWNTDAFGQHPMNVANPVTGPTGCVEVPLAA